MSYIDAERKGNDVVVWERNNGIRDIKRYKEPFYFYTKDTNGAYTSIFGESLAKHEFETYDSYKSSVDLYKSTGEQLYESDIPQEIKILSKHYYDIEAPRLHVTFLDIEVDYCPLRGGFASASNPYAVINAIAMFHTHLQRYVILAIPPNFSELNRNTNATWTPGPLGEEDIAKLQDISPFNGDIDIILFDNEKDLLETFLENIMDTDILCGWNSEFFDIPYIGKRLEMLGTSYLNKLSFQGARKPSWNTTKKYGNEEIVLGIHGRVALDYLDLFRKYELKPRRSYKLKNIAADVLKDMDKLDYTGSLAELYKNDFIHFLRYNIRDTEILNGFEQKLAYVDIANRMAHTSTALFKSVMGTVVLTELAIVNHCHYVKNVICPDGKKITEKNSIKGAFVLIPQVGMHERIGSIDINSLYPSAECAINMSPETLYGQFDGEEEDYIAIIEESDKEVTATFDRHEFIPPDLRGKKLSAPAKEWKNILRENMFAISGFGTIFSQHKKGVIPEVLDSWRATRVNGQALKAKYKKEGNIELATYHDRVQYIMKIKLNSLYGALTNKYFKFFDLRLGESTTSTGRKILLHQCAKVCELLDGQYTMPDITIIDAEKKKKDLQNEENSIEFNSELDELDDWLDDDDEEDEDTVHFGYSKKWSVVYGDTDSTYFRMPDVGTTEEIVQLADEIGEEVNNSFQQYMIDNFLCQPEYDKYIKCGREIVARAGIFVKKKRYILNVINDDGDWVDKIKVMGLETKKTIIPEQVANDLNEFINRILHGEDWKNIRRDIVEYKKQFKNQPLIDIGVPIGINNVEKFEKNYSENTKCFLPGHVAPAILYNECLKKYNDVESIPITSGSKIRLIYLKNKYYRFKAVAFPADIGDIPNWFYENFNPDPQLHVDKLIDGPLNNILAAIGKISPTEQDMTIESMLEF
jgi:DNA polymerase elongation subunit (family B)